MNQLESNARRSSSAGKSRGRVSDTGAGRTVSRTSSSRSGSSRSSGTRSTSSRSTASRTGSSRTSSSYRSGQAGRANAAATARRNSTRRRKKGPDYGKIALIGVILLVLIACIALAFKGGKKSGSEETEIETSEQPAETEIMKEVTVDGINITGMSRNQAKNAVLAEFPWDMTVTFETDTYSVTNLMAEKVDALLEEIYSGEPKESYTLDTSGLEEQAAAEAAACAAKWDKKAKNGSIDSFDASKNQFVFAGEENGLAIDQEKLAADILQALKDKKFDAAITASANTVAPEISAAAAKEKYKTISTVTTNTTANSNRNTNVRLAAEAINGSVVKPGQEFSFNKTVGQRTEAKGYKGAAAYNNGEVVQEIGGGVCQVSTTLYNAVYRAGLQISVRRSHTFEPSYITPGQDATVSWDQPDFCFVNNSSTAIGIKASYANQKVTVSVYGIPILEDGVKWDLKSEKTEDLDVPAPTYQEDQTLQPGEEKQKSAGTSGSRWVTYKVVYKDGVEVSREVDHKTTYKGHAPVILRNTSGVVLNPSETTTPAETPVPTVDGMPEGYVPSETVIPVPGGEYSGSTEGGPGTQTEGSEAPAETQVSAPGTAVPETTGQTAAAPAPGDQGPSSNDGEAVVVPLKPE